MSRIGKKPIDLPENVLVKLDKNILIIKGKYGLLEQPITDLLNIDIQKNKIYITRKEETIKAKQLHGLIRALVQNSITGVSKKFSKILIAEGVGYKFQLDKKKLLLNAGFTHQIEFLIPEDIDIKVESPVKISIYGINKEKVGYLADKIRSTKPPEPYKGKGILYEGEIIKRKAGKTGKK